MQSNRRRWSRVEDSRLLNFAGEKTVLELGNLLRRTESGIYHRLAHLKVSGRVRDGYTMREVADHLHVDYGKLRQWLLDGKLESQSLRVTRNSIKKLCERGSAEIFSKDNPLAVLGRLPPEVLKTMQRVERTAREKRKRTRRSRTITRSYTFARAGRILRVGQEVVKQLVEASMLKLSRVRIEEDAIQKFVTSFPSEVNWGLIEEDLPACLKL